MRKSLEQAEEGKDEADDDDQAHDIDDGIHDGVLRFFEIAKTSNPDVGSSAAHGSVNGSRQMPTIVE